MKILLDTDVIIHSFNKSDSTYSNKIIELIGKATIEFYVSSRTLSEIPQNIENLEKRNYLKTLDIKSSIFRLDYSAYGIDSYATKEDIELNKQIVKIINRGNPIADADILQFAMKNEIDVFITCNIKDFIKKDNTRDKLEMLTGLKIYTPKEFILNVLPRQNK